MTAFIEFTLQKSTRIGSHQRSEIRQQRFLLEDRVKLLEI